MVVPKAVLALVTRASEETFQTEGDVGLIVDVTVRIAGSLAAYHIVGGSTPLLPDNPVDSLLEVGQTTHILHPTRIKLSVKYEQGEKLTFVFFFRASMSLSISTVFTAAWSI